MSRLFFTFPALLGAFSMTLYAQTTGGRTGTGPTSATRAAATQAPPRVGTATNTGVVNSPPLASTSTAPGAVGTATSTAPGTSTFTGTLPGLPDNANRDIVLSPTESDQQFQQQRAIELNGNRNFNNAANAPGSSVPVPGAATTAPGNVIQGQVVNLVPGRSITVRDVSGLVRTFPLPANYSLPVDVANGSVVVVTVMNGGFATVANATGVLPASAVTGGAGQSSAIITQQAAANDSIYRPNLTTEPIPQSTISGIGGFYMPGPGAIGYTTGNQSAVGGTLSGGGVTVETNPYGPFANGSFASASTPGANNTYGAAPYGTSASGAYGTTALAGGSFASSGLTGTVSMPVTSLSYNPTPLATMVARMEGNTARLPNAALHGGALATISGTGRNLVTRTALPTYRVVSWNGTTLVAVDDHGRRYRFTVSDRARVPNNLQAGKLVVVDARGSVARSVRYPL